MKYLKYSDKYEKQVIALLNNCFPGKKITRESFNWKHFYKNGNNKHSAYIALNDGKVLSFVCFSPINIIRSGVASVYYSCTVQATLPEYRRKGLVTDLTLLAGKDLGESVSYLGFSNGSGVKIDLFSKKINYSILGRMETRYFVPFPSESDIKINEIPEKKFLALNKESVLNFFSIDRSAEYLKWKFSKNPKRKYSFAEIMNNGEYSGSIIYTLTGIKMEIYLILLKEYSILYDTMIAVKNFAFRKKVILISFTVLDNNFWTGNLPGNIFRKKTDVYFTVKTTKGMLTDKENWLIQGGDIQ